jgi:hypothetical protein
MKRVLSVIKKKKKDYLKFENKFKIELELQDEENFNKNFFQGN